MIPLGSHITQSVLSYFFLHDEASLYVNEIARRLNLDSGNLTRKLKDLEAGGLLKSERRGNLKTYSLNSAFPLLNEYRQIFLKTHGIEGQLRAALGKIDGVDGAFLFGSYANNKMDPASDIDLLVIGTHNTLDLQKALAQIQASTDRAINTVELDPAEFKKKQRNDPFIKGVMSKKRIALL